jgi:transcriptional regulator with XRE-family HTH domain
MTQPELQAKMKATREKNKIGLRKMERETGLGRTQIKKMENDPDYNFTLCGLYKYCNYVGLTVHLTTK